MESSITILSLDSRLTSLTVIMIPLERVVYKVSLILMEQSTPNSSTPRSTLTPQIEELLKRKNDMFDFESKTEDLDDLADEIFEALYQHTSSQRNETETETG